MGKEAYKKAKKLGMLNKPKYTFYYTPKKIKHKFSKIKPDVAYLIEDWMVKIDPSTIMSETQATSKTFVFFHVAPNANLYVQVVFKMSGYMNFNAETHAAKIDIFTDNQDHPKAIVQGINKIWEDGIVNHLNLKRLGKKFKVSSEEILNAWNSFL
jgi:hypothetical protein